MQNLTNEQGSVLVFITLMIVILMVMVGFGLDTGFMTYTRNTGQSALDAAALSAVSGLPDARRTNSDAPVNNRAVVYNSDNNYVTSNQNPIASTNVSYVTYDFSTGAIAYGVSRNAANGVRVAMESANNDPLQAPAFLTPLLKLMGKSASASNPVSVSAVATIQARPAIPIALWETQCGVGNPPQTDVKIEMQHPDQTDTGENACWTTFFDCSSGAPDIKGGFTTASTCSGSGIDGNITIGSLICQNKGQVNTVLGAAQDFFLDTPANFGQWWIIPVLSGGGNCSPTNPTAVKDFAKIRVTKVDKTGNPKYIQADIQCGQSLNALDESLCFSHRLVREPTKGY
jgi:Flp pilus assembly protein TadG